MDKVEQANSFLNIIRSIIKEEQNKRDRVEICQVDSVNDDGTVNIKMLSDFESVRIIPNISNQSIYRFKSGDLAIIYMIQNQLSNAFIIAKCGPTSETDTKLNGKQNSLSDTQLNAVNSGITSSKVSTYDGYSTSKQDKLTAGANIRFSGSTISAANPSSNIKIYKLEQSLSISPNAEKAFSLIAYTMGRKKYHIDLFVDCNVADGSAIMSAQITIKRGSEALLHNICRTTLNAGGGVMCSVSYDNTSGNGTEIIYPYSYNYTGSNKQFRATLYIMEIS